MGGVQGSGIGGLRLNVRRIASCALQKANVDAGLKSGSYYQAGAPVGWQFATFAASLIPVSFGLPCSIARERISTSSGTSSRPLSANQVKRRGDRQTARFRPAKPSLCLVQPELARDEAELGRRDQAPMHHANAIERAVEIGRPEIEEVGELGKARREVVVLPDIALQQLRDGRAGDRGFPPW